jgi:tetratricopeptide (TPR) repeat protein
MAPILLSNHCDAVQARLLIELGRWGEAETLLTRAMAEFEATMGQPGWHPEIFLADLRILQGRYTDAEALLLGKDQALDALLPAARLHLSRGDHELAVASARRGLRALGTDHLRAREALAVVVEAELARGDLDAASRACEDLAARTGEVDPPVLRARAALPRARALAARGEPGAAVALLEEAADPLDPERTPWQLVRVLVELARVREELGDLPAATIDAKAALAALAGLDVIVSTEDRTLLERLAAHRQAPTSPPSSTATLVRDGKWWSATAGGTQVRLPDTKGLRYLAELVAAPGVERHVLDLVDRIEGASEDAGVDRRQLGHAGDLLDGRARLAYRRRVEALRSEIDDALAIDAVDRAEVLQAELDTLVAELARAFGVGGRSRQASSAAERARLNVTRALRSAIAKLCGALPGAGDVLDRRVRTGTYCIYEPAAGEIPWIVQS